MEVYPKETTVDVDFGHLHNSTTFAKSSKTYENKEGLPSIS